ncbi:MAG TPA: class I SAM-dependent methyltransferase [Anaerolineae bacterium]|nr:class I SAM-dependent methyltransferase [Anaerolineae bacterium]
MFELMYLLGRTPWDTGISPPELIAFLENHEPGRALDIGCGTGTNLITMARRGWQVTGVDVSSRAIRQAQRKAYAAGLQIQLIRDDVTSVHTVAGTFDLALDIGCFHSLSREERIRYASNLTRFIKPGGTFLLYTWLEQNTESENRHPSQESVTHLFGQNFELTSIEHGAHRQRISAWFTFQRKV